MALPLDVFTRRLPILAGDFLLLLLDPAEFRSREHPDRSASIRLNTDLAKKPPECLEYMVVHEMVHILEPTHNARFMDLMDRMMPNWRFYRQLLNRLPVRHETRDY
jgi:hypothetical protein